MTPEEIKLKLTERQVLALTLYGEARAEPIEGMLAVGACIRNRVLTPHRFGDGYKSVCLRKSQFSCWWQFGGKSNYDHLMDLAKRILIGDQLLLIETALLNRCYYVADGFLNGIFKASVIKRANHYYNPLAMVPVNRVPDWAKGKTPTATVGSHKFYEVL